MTTDNPVSVLTAQQRYEQEAMKSDKDHHLPTAGAMTGHIIANLFLDMLKIRQARWFATGSTRLFLEIHSREWITYEATMIESLDDALSSDNEMIPTTTAQLSEYGALEENPARKYEDGAAQLADLIHDFDWQLIYVGKAITLAAAEGKTSLGSTLSDLRAWAKHQIREAQLFLGNDATDGLYKEVDDDEDDNDNGR